MICDISYFSWKREFGELSQGGQRFGRCPVTTFGPRPRGLERIVLHRKTMGKPWDNHGKTMGQPWENHGKTMGKPWEKGGLMGFNGV